MIKIHYYEIHENEDEFHFGKDLRELFTFEEFYDNYEIVEKLIKAKVINKTCHEDSETAETVIKFKRKKDAYDFIDRLNVYLEKRNKKYIDLKNKLKNLP